VIEGVQQRRGQASPACRANEESRGEGGGHEGKAGYGRTEEWEGGWRREGVGGRGVSFRR